MNDNRQMEEVHYVDIGFPYTVTESFMDLFEGLTYSQSDAAHGGNLQDQGNPCWSTTQTSTYKYGYSGPASHSYCSYSHAYDVNDHTQRVDESRRFWESLAPINYEEVSTLLLHGDEDSGVSNGIQECGRSHHDASGQDYWQDNIDLDNMTYEELVDLTEAVGTQNRGLSKEQISSLPISKYKYSFFSRKRARHERCVICQMNYKRGDKQMILPCKHVYHVGCVSRWLGINKACPICFVDVFGNKATTN